MKYIPMLYSSPMVLALLDDRKSQTRRMKGLKSINDRPDDWEIGSDGIVLIKDELWVPFQNKTSGATTWIKCPYGKSEDVHWVRETIYQNGELGLEYVARREDIDENIIPLNINVRVDKAGNYKFCKIPNIYMEKWACRIFLKVKSVRVERLKDISEADAIAEGIESVNGGWKDYYYKGVGDCGLASASYLTLWQSINKDFDPIDDNPWVWCIEFEKVKRPENFLS